MTEIGYTATKRDLLRNSNALVGNDIYHWFDSTRGWRRIGSFAPDFIEQRVDSNGLIQGIMDPAVPLLDDHVMNATINLNIITTDDNGDAINWNRREVSGLGNNPNMILATLTNNAGIISATNINDYGGASTLVHYYTSGKPYFAGEDSVSWNTDGTYVAGNSRNSTWKNRYEFFVTYGHTLVQISNYNHPKIGEMVGIGSALTSFKSTNTGTTQNQSLGLDKHDDITINKIEDPVSRTYTLKNNRYVYQMENPSPKDISKTNNSTSVSSNNNFKGYYRLDQRNVHNPQGLEISKDGSSMYVLNKSNTKAIIQYDLDSAYDIRSAIYRSEEFAHDMLGPKTKFSHDGKYMFSLKYVPITRYINATRNSTSYGTKEYYSVWPKFATLTRWTLETPYAAHTAGLTKHPSINYTYINDHGSVDQTYNLPYEMNQDRHKRYFHPSATVKATSGLYNPVGSNYWWYWYYYAYWVHFGANTGFCFSSDGMYMYWVTQRIVDRGRLFGSPLSTPYQISSASIYNFGGDNSFTEHTIGSSTTTNEEQRNWKTNGIWDMAVSSDGKSFYFLDTTTKSIMQYNTVTANNIADTSAGSTQGFNRSFLEPVSRAVSNNGFDAQLVLSDIPNLGKRPPQAVRTQNATQPFDLTDRTMIRNFQFNKEGDRIYVGTDRKIYQYYLTTAWDISTALYVSTNSDYDILDQHDSITGVGFWYDSAAKKIYFSNRRRFTDRPNREDYLEQRISEYNIVDSIGSGVPAYPVKHYLLDSSDWADIALNDSGNKMYVAGPNKVLRLSLGANGIISSVNFESNFTLHGDRKVSGRAIDISRQEHRLYMADSDNTMLQFSMRFDSVFYDSNKISFTNISDNPNEDIQGMKFESDGKSFVVAGDDRIEQYKMRNPFDIKPV